MTFLRARLRGVRLRAALCVCALLALGGASTAFAAQTGVAEDAFAAVLDAGESNNCAIRENGSLQCWGSFGSLQSTPPTTGRYVAVSAGYDHACAIRGNGLLSCWGQSASVGTPPTGTFLAVSAGQGETCALRSDSRLACWGGTLAAAAPTGAGYIAVSVAHQRGCALRGDGSLECWQPSGVASLGPEPSGRFIAVAAGSAHACAVRSDGAAVCWGSDAQGQSNPPAAETFTAVTVGHQFSCGLRANGSIACWGLNTAGQTSAPAGRFTAISAGRSHACARAVDGGTRCWGSNTFNERNAPYYRFEALAMGGGEACALDFDGNRTCVGETDGPLRPAVGRFKALSFGPTTACGIGRDDRVQCWGAAIGTLPTERIGAISVGHTHACGLRPDGTVLCWGADGTPPLTPPTGRFYYLASGDGFTCGIRDNNSVDCWGQGGAALLAQVPVGNAYGRISAYAGNVCLTSFAGRAYCVGAQAAQLTPPTDVTHAEIAVGANHACSTGSNGRVRCWGANQSGQALPPATDTFFALAAAGDATCALGSSTMRCWGATLANLPAPTYLIGRGTIAAGTAHTCQTAGNGGVSCWGDGGFGQGAAPVGYRRELSADGDRNCAIGGDGSLRCWGDNTHGGATPPAGAMRQLDVGQFNGCAVTSAGALNCWGWNVNAQSAPPPELARTTATGLNHSCAVLDTGALQCWGYNADGQATPPAGAFKTVAVGERHSCAIAENGGIQCWGLGSEGQAAPPELPGATYRALAAGAFHNCAILAHGGIACWGRNSHGQATPPEEGAFVSIAAGFGHSCAIRDDGVRLCWGDNTDGQAPAPSIGPQTLPPAGAGGVDYAVDFTMQADGYTAVAPKFRFIAGQVPQGLQLDANGRFAGRVNDALGVYTFTLEAQDQNGFYVTRDLQLTVVDGTPPTIVPLINGSNTLQPWYNNNVQLQWQITDWQSAVSGTSGCGTLTITEDTDGTDYTCTATSGGGTASRTVTIRRDTVGPDTRLDQTPNLPQWGTTFYSAEFAFSMLGTDPSGLAGFECSLTPMFPANFFFDCPSPRAFGSLQLDTQYTFQVRAKDTAGNVDPSPASYSFRVSRDTTPPLITPVFDGVLGDNGWYRSDVRVSWTVVDPESPITSTTGCQPVTVTVDTGPQGQIVGGCGATSSGGERWSYPSVRRDASPPYIGASFSTQPNAAGWYRDAVTRLFSCGDGYSGLAIACPAQTTLGDEGTAVLFPVVTVRDNAGNTASVPEVAVKIDRTAPSLIVTEEGTPNADGWYRDLTLRFACSDALSGLADACPAALRVVSGINTLTTAGALISDNAGNLTSVFRSYKVDTTAPNLSLPNLPYPVLLNATTGQYLPSASDIHSGLASVVCTPLDTASVGEKTLSCTATDNVGNTTTRSATYVVGYDFMALSEPLSGNSTQLFQLQAPRSLRMDFRLRDANGVAVLNAALAQTRVVPVACNGTIQQMRTTPVSETDSFEHQGSGMYRRNLWLNYTATGCFRVELILNDGVVRSGLIRVLPKNVRTPSPYPASRPPATTSRAAPAQPTRVAPARATPAHPRRPNLNGSRKK